MISRISTGGLGTAALAGPLPHICGQSFQNWNFVVGILWVSANSLEGVNRAQANLQFVVSQLIDGTIEHLDYMVSLRDFGLLKGSDRLPIGCAAAPPSENRPDNGRDNKAIISDQLTDLDQKSDTIRRRGV